MYLRSASTLSSYSSSLSLLLLLPLRATARTRITTTATTTARGTSLGTSWTTATTTAVLDRHCQLRQFRQFRQPYRRLNNDHGYGHGHGMLFLARTNADTNTNTNINPSSVAKSRLGAAAWLGNSTRSSSSSSSSSSASSSSSSVKKPDQRPEDEPAAPNPIEPKSTTTPPATPPAPPLRENIYTIPNLLTFSRLLTAPLIGWSIMSDRPATTLSLFAYAALTDLLDGGVARYCNQRSVVGTVLDPMADKTLMTVAVVCLTAQGGLPFWLATLIVGRDTALGVSALYFRWVSLPAPKTMARYWDFSLPSAEVRPTAISKANTLLQLLLVSGVIVLPVLPALPVLPGGWDDGGGYGIVRDAVGALGYVVAATTVLSGLSYVVSKDAVRFVGKKDVARRAATAAAAAAAAKAKRK